MVEKNFDTCQTKERRKRRLLNYSPLKFKEILFIFLFSGLLVRLSNQTPSIIKLFVDGNCDDLRIINSDFSLKLSQVEVNDQLNNNCKETCSLSGETRITLTFNDGLDSCSNMFLNRKNIKEVDLTNFDASQVKVMDSMFKGCSNLKQVTFGTIDTSNVGSVRELFQDCPLLESIDLSNLNIAKITDISYMFKGCSGLKRVSFGSTTLHIKGMVSLFEGCSSLISVDLSIFDTSLVENLEKVFDGCKNLEELNLETLNTSLVKGMYGFCSHCAKLTS